MASNSLRRRTTTVLLIAAVAIAVLGLLLLSTVTRNSAEFSDLYQVILFVNAIGVALLLFLIGGNLVSLVADYRDDVPGTRLKARLIVAFVALVIVPVAIIYAYSIQFLNTDIDSWFDVQVEQGLEDALELSRTALNVRTRDNLEQTRRMADSIYGATEAEAFSLLTRLRSQSDAQSVTLFEGGTRILATTSTRPTQEVPMMPTDEILFSLQRDGFYVSLEPQADGDYLVRAAVAVSDPGSRRPRVLQAIYPLGAKFATLTDSVQDTVSRYRQLAFLREPLKSSFVVTLSMVVLICLSLSVYGAFFFARRLTAPVQNLAAGTRAVARGDFDTRLPSSSHDEIGFLVDSFNDMISQLSSAREDTQRSEAQVENERASLEAILARLSTGVIALENNLTIRTANEAVGTILGIDFRVHEGRSIFALAEEFPSLKQFVDVCESHLQTDEFEWREQVSMRIDGDVRVLVCACSEMPASYSSLSGYVVVIDDITDLLRVQRDAAWGEVARRLAHEIKNPLTPIQLSAERIRRKFLDVVDKKDAATLDRATQTIIQQVEAMRDMVNAFSEYARAPEINLAVIDINNLITQVADLYPAYQSNARIHLDLDKQLTEISVDAVRMRQVLHNLIRNALEATEDQSAAKVTISSRLLQRKGAAWAEIAVKDDGPGFPTENREHIFEPYVTTKAKGTGLGLAIVRKLIEEHGGHVSIESEPGQGATVLFDLPLKRSGQANDEFNRITELRA